jgi:DNA-binding transcriptional LysR family regulator
LEAARQESVSKAADKLHLPQPSVTKYLKKLESRLKVQLFERTNRGLHLTAAGESLFRQLTLVDSQMHEILHGTLKNTGEVVGGISLGCHRVVALNYLPEPISEIYRRHPQLQVELTLATSLEVSRMVSAGKLDYGLVVNPLPLPGLVIRKFIEESVAIFATNDRDLKSLNRVLYNPEMQGIPRIMRRLVNLKLEAIPDYDVIASLVTRSHNVGALVPELVARRFGLQNQLSPIFYRGTIALIFRSSMQKNARHRAMTEIFVGK